MKIVKEFILREIAGETVLVPVGKTSQEFNGMLTLTETAALIWKNYEKTDNLEEMVQLLLDTYEVSEEQARYDVIGFTNALMQQGIVATTREDGLW